MMPRMPKGGRRPAWTAGNRLYMTSFRGGGDRRVCAEMRRNLGWIDDQWQVPFHPSKAPKTQ